MFEIFKELLERPEKTKRYFLFLVHWVLVGILTSEVYVSLFGTYDLIVFSDTDFWKQFYFFILNGKVLLVLFLLLGLHFILDFLLSAFLQLVGFGLEKLFSFKKKNPLLDHRFVRDMLLFFKVLERDKEEKVLVPGIYFTSGYEVLELASKESLLENVHEIRHSLLMEIYSTLLLFSLVYYFVLPIDVFALDVFVALAIFITSILVLFFYFISAFIQQYYDLFADKLRLLKQVQVVDAFLAKHAIKVVLDSKYNHSKSLQLGEKVYFLQHYDFNTAFKDVISSFSDSKEKVKVVLILHKPLPLALYAAVKEYPELTLFTFSTAEQLELDLENYFKEGL